MNLTEINKILERINRLVKQIEDKEPTDFEWDHTFPDGFKCTCKVNNVKNPEEIEDTLTSAFLWLWSSKDYLKNLVKAKGGNPNIVEKLINQDDYLPLCGDIANKLKHSHLTRTRSKFKPILGNLIISGTSQSYNRKWCLREP